ncbi:MAG: phenylacetate--CoA ligase family protein [Bacteroidia bacterium]|nr:phenylacetate--CoA ligase family protein [Bacteroidia bacterium]
MNIADYLKKDITQWPNWINYILLKINVFGKLVYGFSYIKMRKQIHKQDPEKLLIESVNHAIKNVKYYRDRYGDLRINSIEEFKSKIGFIDKDEVMEHWDDFLVDNIDLKKCNIGTTGGTSGKQLKLVTPKNRYIIELAHIHQLWEKTGWNFNVRAVIRNHKLPNSKIYTINPVTKEIIFDAFRTTDVYYKQIYDVMRKFNIKYLHTYPSSAYQFSLFLKKYKLDVSFIYSFFCGSESLLDEQKYLIQNQLGINIYHWYGHSEKLILGGYCNENQLIHIEPTYGFFELINESVTKNVEINEIGEITGTTFFNNYMPLIRYKTGDFAEYGGSYCNSCKQSLPILKNIYGRWDKNKIYRKDGTYITSTALNLHSNLYDKIDGIQYFQEEKGRLEIKIVKNENFTNDDFDELLNHYNESFGIDNKIDIQFVQNLEKLPNGKFLNLISKLN